MSAVRAEMGGPRRVTGGQASGLTRTRLAWLQATHRRGWATALWLCLAAAVALPVLLLLVGAMAVESSLDQTLAADGGFSVQQNVADVDAFNALGGQVNARVAARTGAALVPLGATASAGPLHLVSVGVLPVQPALAQRTLTAIYAAHLGAHVAVIDGQLPPEGLGGGETAVSMPRAAADQLGLQLSDRVCTDFTAGAGAQPRWCARIVGLWQPLDPGDPYWAGAPPGLEVTMGRYDLFQLARLGPPQPPTATFHYWASADAVAPGGATGLAGQVTALTEDLRAPQRHVDTGLERALLAFDQRRRTMSAAIDAVAVIAAAAGLGAAALALGRFLETQSSPLALLRARGWPRSRTWRVAFLGPAGLGLTAVPAGLAACLLCAGALTLAGTGLTVQALPRADLVGIAAAAGVLAAALVGLLALMAGLAVWRDPRASPQPAGRPQDAAWAVAAAAAAAVGIGAVALPHLPGSGPALGLGQAGADTALVVPALGVVLAAAAAAWLPLPGWVPQRDGVPGTLASLQLRRRPRQHAGAAFVMTLAAAAGVFAALAVTADPAGGQAPLRLGTDIALGAGAAGGALLALAGFAVHFRSASRRRVREYGGLFAHGLPPALVACSLGAERAATAGAGLVVGSVLGLALALAVLPALAPAGAFAGPAAVAVLLVAARLAGSPSRRLPARVDPLQMQRLG